ncbi:MAG TPA: hypothetical protein DF427_05645 [Moraxellaceae bacterium]|nr:hypothetical protein [Moraxellaceae bacterium]
MRESLLLTAGRGAGDFFPDGIPLNLHRITQDVAHRQRRRSASRFGLCDVLCAVRCGADAGQSFCQTGQGATLTGSSPEFL